MMRALTRAHETPSEKQLRKLLKRIESQADDENL